MLGTVVQWYSGTVVHTPRNSFSQNMQSQYWSISTLSYKVSELYLGQTPVVSLLIVITLWVHLVGIVQRLEWVGPSKPVCHSLFFCSFTRQYYLSS